MEYLAEFEEWFWSEKFWLPPNNTWADLERDDTLYVPRPADLWFTIPVAVVLFFMRLLWERYIATPIGRSYGLREKPSPRPMRNEILETAFKSHHKLMPTDKRTLETLSEKSCLTTRQVERWWRLRRTVGKHSEMQRFRETTWRFLFYLLAFWYGMIVLWDKPWFSDTKSCWYGYPKQHVSTDIYWYYMIELGFYVSLILSLFMDAKRKDFAEMIVHHIATITLMVFSWGNNMVRVGTLVLVIHDAVDYLLEGAKIAKYLKYHKLCDVLFLVFTIVWFITRIVIYPLKVVYSTAYESTMIIGFWPSWFLFNGLLMTLQVLHIIWFHMILRMVYAYVVVGKVEKDERSETDPDTDSADEAVSEKNQSKENGGALIRNDVGNNNSKKGK